MLKSTPLLLVLLLCGCSDPVSPYADHNVIVIVIDTLRRDRLNPSGDEFLEKLSREAVCFSNAVAPSSWTRPSVASIMTGLYPGNHGAVRREIIDEGPGSMGTRFLDPELLTLAECLKEAGYNTAAFVTNPNIIPIRRFDQGFDEFTQPAGNARQLFGAAGDWIKANKGRGKFHLYLHALDPHAPYYPPQRYRDRFLEDRRIDKAPFTNSGYPEGIEFWLKQYRAWDKGEPFRFDYKGEFEALMKKYAALMNDVTLEQVKAMVDLDFTGFDDPAFVERLEHLVTLYNAEVAYVNYTVSVFFDVLEKEGLLDTSIVVVTSDHGEAFMEHEELRHDRTVFTEEVDVPLIFRIPGRKGVVDPPVSLTDIMPTILDLLGLPMPGNLDGISLQPHMVHGTAPVNRLIFTELIHRRTDRIAVVHGDRKLIYLQKPDRAPEWSLYDISDDPGEESPLPLEAWDGGARALKEAILRFKKDRKLQRSSASEEVLSEEELKQLQELGYM